MEETIYVVEDDDDEEEVVKVSNEVARLIEIADLIDPQTIKKQSEMLFIRGRFWSLVAVYFVPNENSCISGDSVVLISPQAPS